MATQVPPDRLHEAVAELAGHICNSESLSRAIVDVGARSFGLSDLRLEDESLPNPLCDSSHMRIPLIPGLWLTCSPPPPELRAELQTYGAVASALLKRSICCDAGVREYAAVLAKLDQMHRDLDAAHRTEWIAEERIRIAQDLHDRVAQTLFGLGLTADWLLAHVDADDGLRPDLERVKSMAATGMRQVREAIFSLSSAPIDPEQFRAAVKTLLRDVEAAGVTAHLQMWGEPRQLPPAVTDGLYQIIREALVNVRRHSQATSVLVSIRIENSAVTAVVQDDGIGLPAGVLDTFRKNGSHLGLRGMESRAEHMGGHLTLSHGDDVGLIVTVIIPLRGEPSNG